MSTEKTGKNTKGNWKSTQSPIRAIQADKSNQDLLDRSKYSLDVVNGWIASADAKISTSCGVFSAAVALLVFVAENILSKVDTSKGTIELYKALFIIVAVCAVITFLLSLFFHLFALNPSFFPGLKKNDHSKKRKCNIFYEDIKDYKNTEEYIKSVKEMSEDQFIGDVLREVYANSDICSKKMHRFRNGLWLAFVTILLIFVCAFCYFEMYQQ